MNKGNYVTCTATRLGLGEFITWDSSEQSEKNVLLEVFTLLQLLQYYGTGFFSKLQMVLKIR